MTDELTVGHRYWLKDGSEVELCAVTTDGALLVSPLVEFETYDGTERANGAPIFVGEVFASAPVAVISAEVTELLAEKAGLEKQVAGLRRDVLGAAKDNADLIKKLSKFKGLEHIEAFIEGRITHVVVEEWDGIKVGPISLLEEKTDSNYRKPEGIRLVSLYGKTGGDLEWKVNEYRDGSGSGWRLIVPAESQEHGEELRRQMVADKLTEAWAEFAKGRKYLLSAWVPRARELGVPVPDDMAAAYAVEKAEGDAKTAETLRKEIAERQTKLDVLTATPPISGA